MEAGTPLPLHPPYTPHTHPATHVLCSVYTHLLGDGLCLMLACMLQHLTLQYLAHGGCLGLCRCLRFDILLLALCLRAGD